MFLFLVLPACTTVQRQVETRAATQRSEDMDGEKIVFLHFVMRADTLTHRDSIELTSVQIAKGMLKQRTAHKEHLPPNHLLITALDAQQQPVQQLTVEHPLRRTVEYIGDDEALHTTRLNLSEATFFIRLRYHPSIVALRAEERAERGTLQLVAVVPLQQIHNNR